MSLPPTYTNILNDLNRDVLRSKPSDPLQFCANWFNSRLEEQRRQLLAQKSSDPSYRSAAIAGYSASIAPDAEPGRNVPGNASPTQKPSLFESDPFSQSAASGPLSSTPFSGSWSSNSDPASTPSFPHAGSGAQDGASFIPPTFNLGRRTSVSAESMAPSTGAGDQVKAALPKTVIPKSEEQMNRIRVSIGNNLLFRNLEQDQYKDVLLAMKEVKLDSGVAVIEQGAQGDYFYVVENGTLDVYIRSTGPVSTQSSDDGTGPSSSLSALGEKKLSYGAGSSFGELALLYAQPRAATVISTSPCTLWALDRITFRSILMETNSRRRALYEKFLKDVPLFEHLSAAERAKISDSLEPRDYAIGDKVISQGERGSEFFIIVEGNAEVRKTMSAEDGGHEETVGKLSRGDYFGELALLNNAPRAASIVAAAPPNSSVDKLRVVTMSERAFTRLLGPLAGIMGRHAKEAYGHYNSASTGVSGLGTDSGQGLQPMAEDSAFSPHPTDSTAKPGEGAWSAPNPFALSGSAGAAPSLGNAAFSGMSSPGP